MKQSHSTRLRTVLFVCFNVFTMSYSFASGSKMPEVGNKNTSGTQYEATAPEAYNNPWKKSNTSIVIDAYEGNSIDWGKMATDSKVAAVVHRVSIGSKLDQAYEGRKSEALKRGYLWGAYHLGMKGNTIAQADLFLSKVASDPNTLMVLDLEDTSNGTFMTVNESIVFMEHVYEKTGRIPVVYANQATVKALNEKVKDHPILQQSKLWYARFTSKVTDFPKGIWNGYFLWQFSSELNCSTTGSCLYNVPGTKADMDINVFFGTPADLASQWNN